VGGGAPDGVSNTIPDIPAIAEDSVELSEIAAVEESA
jgi:hypothetical protein